MSIFTVLNNYAISVARELSSQGNELLCKAFRGLDCAEATSVVSSFRFSVYVLLSLITLFGIVQSSARLGLSLSVDEPFSANLVRLSWPQMFEAFLQDNPSVTYYMLLKVWTQIFGESEIALRSLSMLFFGLSILIVGLIAKRSAGLKAGVVAALLMSLSAFGLVYATTVRQYALLCLLVATATLISFRLMQLGESCPDCLGRVSSPKNICLGLGLIVVNVLGLLTQPIYIFFMCAYSVAGLFVSRQVVLLLALCSVVSVVLYVGLWWPILRVTLPLPATNWMGTPGLIELTRAFAKLWGTANSTLLLVYLIGITLFSFRQGIRVFKGRLVLVSLGVIAIASLLPFLASQFRPVFIETRTPVIFLPMACVLVATLISQLGNWTLNVIVLSLLVVSSTISSVQAFTGPDPYPVRAAVQYVLSEAKCGDTLVLGSLTIGEVEYYLRQFNAPDCLKRETFPLDTQRHPGWMDVPGLLSRRDELTQEAAATAARLARRSKSMVWLFHSSGTRYGYEVTDIIEEQLNRQLTLVEVLDLSGTYFDTVLVYSTDEP